MARLTSLLRISTLSLIPFLLSGCGPDLGVYSKEGETLDEYYDSFGDMKCLFDGGDHSYDVEDSLYNEKTINEFTWEDEDDAVEEEEYLYLIIPFNEELNIEAIVLFAYSEENIDVEINCFYFASESSTPQKIKYLSSPDTETKDDQEVEIVYDDPPKEASLVTVETSFVKEEWNNFVLGGFRHDFFADNYLHTNDGGLLYIRIENNSGFNRDTMTSVKFKFINLMVRAVEEEE